MGLIEVKNNLGIPKYKQIINSVENAIENGELKINQQLPSINSIKSKFNLSRDTVLKAYNELKIRGIIESVAGKGYYISSENISIQTKIFLLFDELNSFKEDLYNSFVGSLQNNVQVDIYFHHFNEEVFKKLIIENVNSYNYYVIMPANFNNAKDIISILPKEKVYILDQLQNGLEIYAGIYQNFEKGLYDNLLLHKNSILKYKKFVLIYNPVKQPKKMHVGFKKFCSTVNISHEIINNVINYNVQPNEIYLIPDDKNLFLIIKRIKEKSLELGKEIGLISYNESLLKEILENGITTVSTNFKVMGSKLAEMIEKRQLKLIENPTHLIIRNSI